MLETPQDISRASGTNEVKAGTRIAVFNKRRELLTANAKDAIKLSGTVSSEELTQLEDIARTRVTMRFLRPYIGPCLVAEIEPAETLEPAAFVPLVQQLRDGGQEYPRRLLLKSGWQAPSPVPRLTLEAIQYLYAAGFSLIGVDWPYIDNSDKAMSLMDANGMVWIVSLDLSEIQPFRAYFLSALPLRTDVEGEVPCRAYLVAYGAANV
jgi:hypothetical protein